MHIFISALTGTAGLALSFAVALLAEEFIFGKILCPLLAKPAEARLKSGRMS